ncbi:MAG: thioredoxin [Candidatus Omnitrophica bacterium]|nr:thioredoxin [Candidatus Omnitrophota bacterium]MDD5237043.1 thioredoxin [Candidatus Omnitrophota bacterium]MDD5610236.1 thioredoxin [Candidatus Omnitrophota bacterium]
MSIHHFDEKNFKKEISSSTMPVLVDFWAEWCGPCKMIAPALEELAKEYEGKIKFAKVNIDESRKIAAEYGIMSIPTLMFFKNGQVQEQVVGALNKSQLKKKIENNL